MPLCLLLGAHDDDKEQVQITTTLGTGGVTITLPREPGWLAGWQPGAKARFVISFWKSAHYQGPGRLRILAARRGQAFGPQLRKGRGQESR